MLHQGLDSFTHLSIALRLFLIPLLHRLFQLRNIVLQRIDKLSDAQIARLGKLFLPLFQHIAGLFLHLGRDLRNRFIETGLQGIHRLLMGSISGSQVLGMMHFHFLLRLLNALLQFGNL